MAEIVNEYESVPKRDARLFAATLGEHRPHGVGLRLSGPMGVAAHAVAIGALAFASLTSTRTNLGTHPLSTPLLRFAPPPPPPQSLGTSTGSARVETVSSASVVESPRVSASAFAVIPDQVLAPIFEIAEGVADGFADGDRFGLSGGVVDGVIGGVPGGLIGGVVGGAGTDIPKFPKPDVRPVPVRMPKPRYSEEAIRQNITGSVRLLAVIDHQGRVEVLEVTRSIPELDTIAIQTVESSWRFEPATKNGRPISCVSNLVVRFNLR